MTTTRLTIAAAILGIHFIAPGSAPARPPASRPRIVGISHIGFFTSNLPAAEAFWGSWLGFQSPYVLTRKDGSVRIAFFKINATQHVELFTDVPQAGQGYLSHISFQVSNAEALRAYLERRGVQVPAHAGKTRTVDLAFEVHDPDNHLVEFTQYLSRDWRTMTPDYLPVTRISDHIRHLGVTVGDLAASLRFYRDLLGFREFWRGSGNHGRTLSWVDLRVPDGRDYIELMLYSRPPKGRELGVRNHLSLEVAHVHTAVKRLEARPYFLTYGQAIAPKIGVNHKWQANLFDPDGTRVELMSPGTFDGKRAPSSQAPPPHAQPAAEQPLLPRL
jgi:catechol 2,3-dioxygenase-like lactoylglutathione lyase family enzyme